jgi:2-phosphosulfolactate phosphatase
MTEILISQGHRPPPNPGGATVVIDVIRAFTTAHFAFKGGVREIRLVATAPEALAMKQQQPDLLLAGEISALPIDGFDFGNSPLEMTQADLRGRTLVQRTTNGVIATLAARDSAVVLVAGLINAAATADWLNGQAFPRIVLVASHPDGDEDMACAEYIRGLLGGEGITLEEASRRTRTAYAAKKFLDGRHPRLHAEDIAMAASEERDARPLRVSFDPQPAILPL